MIRFVIVCCLGVVKVVSGVSVYGGGAYTPSPPGSRPPCATKSATFCEKVDAYPSKIIQSLLRSKQVELDDFFTDESEGLEDPPEYILHEDLMTLSKKSTGNRKVRSTVDSSDMSPQLSKKCTVLTKATLPKFPANTEVLWRFNIQDKKKSNKKIRAHLCDKSSEECKKHCTQMYTPVPMISVDAKGVVAKDSFWMPSSCVCQTNPSNIL